MDPPVPSGRMRLPTPARAATAAGLMLAASVLLLAADLAVVQVAGDEADVVPFFVQTENATATGMRITNAGAHDTIRAFEMFGSSACGYAYGDPVHYPGNATTGEHGVIIIGSNLTAGIVTFYVVESVDTIKVLRGESVDTYVTSRRQGADYGIEVTPSNQSTAVSGMARTVVVHVDCEGGHVVALERLHGGNSRFAPDFTSGGLWQPPYDWYLDLPLNQGVDFLYVARADEQPDNETYLLLAQDLRRAGQFWTYAMQDATVFDGDGVLPDRLLRVAASLTLAGAVLFLALGLRAPAASVSPPPTDAAFALVAAGESHLRRLRQAWALVGALLVPILAAATYIVFAVAPFTAPTAGWDEWVGAVVVVLDAAAVALWAFAYLRAQRDLAAWQRSSKRMDDTDLDAL